MKLATYTVKSDELNIQTQGPAGARLGWISGDWVVDAGLAAKWLAVHGMMEFPHEPATDIMTLLERGEGEWRMISRAAKALESQPADRLTVEGEPVAISMNEAKLLAPLPLPSSIRDFYAFEQHVKTSRMRRGLQMIPEWYEIPVFYYSNHRSVIGPDDPVQKPSYTDRLDFELEIACVIGKRGRDIPRERALEHIAGFTVMNDWSARDEQRREMAVGLGPAKGKDFATSLGPWIVTVDELEDRRVGEHWDLAMTARINGTEVSRGNVKDLYWSFAQMIERASRDCELLPGDVIGSGTVGTGCILELGPEIHRWLEPGDVVELEIERIGVLRNRIV